MHNVVSFPIRPTAPQKRARHAGGAKTLFLHVRATTLIVHLAAPRDEMPKGRLGRRS